MPPRRICSGDSPAPFCGFGGNDDVPLTQITDFTGDPLGLGLSLEENRSGNAADLTELIDRDVSGIGDAAYVVAGRISSGFAQAYAEVEAGDERYVVALTAASEDAQDPEELAGLAEQLLALTPAA